MLAEASDAFRWRAGQILSLDHPRRARASLSAFDLSAAEHTQRRHVADADEFRCRFERELAALGPFAVAEDGDVVVIAEANARALASRHCRVRSRPAGAIEQARDLPIGHQPRDMFVVTTATFRFFYALIVLSLDRRQVVHFEVTPNPTQVWLSGQMTEAFPWDTTPRYLLRDRDQSYGPAFRHRVRAMGITEVITAPRSPWQNPYVERLIGSIRRECLDHVIILSEQHLRRVLSSYFQYHHEARTHLSLDKDYPQPSPSNNLRFNSRH